MCRTSREGLGLGVQEGSWVQPAVSFVVWRRHRGQVDGCAVRSESTEMLSGVGHLPSTRSRGHRCCFRRTPRPLGTRRLLEDVGGSRYVKGVVGKDLEVWRSAAEGLEACLADIESGEARLAEDVDRFERELARVNVETAAEKVRGPTRFGVGELPTIECNTDDRLYADCVYVLWRVEHPCFLKWRRWIKGNDCMGQLPRGCKKIRRTTA